MNMVREQLYHNLILQIERGEKKIEDVNFPHDSYYSEFYDEAFDHFSRKDNFKMMAEIYRIQGDYAAAARCATVYGDKSMMVEFYRLKKNNGSV